MDRDDSARSSSLDGPFITLESWVSEGRRQRAPRITQVTPLFENGQAYLYIQGVIADDGLPMSWTFRTRSRVNHRMRTITILLDVYLEALPKVKPRSEPYERVISMSVWPEQSSGAPFEDGTYEVSILSGNGERLARAGLRMSPKPH